MKLIFIILFILILTLPGTKLSGQHVTTVPDSTHAVRKNDKSVTDSKQPKQKPERKNKKDKDKRQDNGQGDQQLNMPGPDNRDQIKRIINARPDLTKIKGARPPDIMRPSGPLLPKGIGKPGGAFRPGGH